MSIDGWMDKLWYKHKMEYYPPWLKDKMRNIKSFKSIFEQKSIHSNTKPEVLGVLHLQE